MKKSVWTIFSVLLIAALTACSSDPAIYTESMSSASMAIANTPENATASSVRESMHVSGEMALPPRTSSRPPPPSPSILPPDNSVENATSLLSSTGRTAGGNVESARLQGSHPLRLVLTKQSNETTVAAPPTAVRTGSAAYHIPKQMIEKEAALVDLWIDRTTTVEQLKQVLAAKLKLTAEKINTRKLRETQPGPTLAQIDGVTIPVGDIMIAQLRGGEDFKIDPKEAMQYSLDGDGRAKWNWRVTPLRASDKGLLLNLDIWIDPGPGKHLIDSFHESVVVTAIPLKWHEKLYKLIQDFNAWLSLLGIGGIGSVAAWFWKKKGSESA